MRKTIVSLFVLLTLFSINTFAANSPRQKVSMEFPGSVRSVAFSPDGQMLAIAGDTNKGIYLWAVALKQTKAILVGHTDKYTTNSVAFSPDGNTLVGGGSDGTVRLWDVVSEELNTVLIGHSESVNSVAFSPDGSILASGSGDNTVRLWDMPSGQPKIILIGHLGGVNSVTFSPDGSTLASSATERTYNMVRLWDVASGQPKTILPFPLHTNLGLSFRSANSVAFSPDGSTLAGAVSRNDDTVRLWDVASEEHKAVLTGHLWGVISVAFSPDGSTLASGGSDNTVRLWDMASGQHKAVLTGHLGSINSVAFSPDGSTLASGSSDRMVRLWDLTTTTTTPAIVRISPASVQSPAIGEKLTVSINIVSGENVVGYQATIGFDPTALLFFSGAKGEYLSDEAFLAAPVVEKNYVTLASTELIGSSNGDGTLATITFQAVDVKTSALALSQVFLVNPEGERLFPCVENGTVTDSIVSDGIVEDSTVIEAVHLAEDVNDDGVVNIQDLVVVSANIGKTGENKADVNGDGVVDIVDLVKVAGALGGAAAAPSVHPQTFAMLTAADVQSWLAQAQHLNLTDIASQRGIRFLEQLLAVLTPQETILLPNYPNPFNPETWIPYQLANSSDVQILIYDTRGIAIRRLALGHQSKGYYTTRSRAAYWDGRNDLGERVATGVYFYQLQTDDMSLMRKMVILK